ncbi:MAG: thymidylate synthase [Candidatus Bathyarchaeia archaeon]
MSGLRAPILSVYGRNVASVWERSVLEVWRRGMEVPTEYGEKAKEATLLMIIEDPFSEPRIHPGDVVAAAGLKSYLKEVLEGSLDAAVNAGKLPYTYHERLFNYEGINQVQYILKKLKEAPYTRRAQAITWKPSKDQSLSSPPCLQRLWFKVYGESLVLQSEWRSRDLFRAAHANILAMTELQRRFAGELGYRVGSYIDFSNSAHIYEGSYGDVERFIKTLEKRRSTGEFLEDKGIKVAFF